MQLLRIALLALAIAWVAPVRAVEVRAVRLWASPEGTQVVLELSGSAKHNLLTLKNPDRVVLDVAGARLSAEARRPPASGVVKEVRMARRPSGELRVVLDLTRPMRAKSFLATPNDRYGYRLVVDLGGGAAAGAAPAAGPGPAPAE